MVGPDGREYHNLVSFAELDPPRRLVLEHMEAEGCEPVRHSMTITLDELPGGKCQLNWRIIFRTVDERAAAVRDYGVDRGLTQTIGRLEVSLARQTSDPISISWAPALVIERVFDAPPALVFRVWTEAEHVKNWWGPADFTAPHVTIDPRVGGTFHFCMRAPDGSELWVAGVFTEVDAPRRLAWTKWFADAQGHRVSATTYKMGDDIPDEIRDTFTFDPVDAGRRTKLTVRSGMPAEVSRRYGEDVGWNSSLDRFAVELARATDTGAY
jgi:uncharacterized protein YndB with AHSA1/START domain